jgi:hypothetical protein
VVTLASEKGKLIRNVQKIRYINLQLKGECKMNTKSTLKTILLSGLVMLVVAGFYLVFSWQEASAKSKDWVGSWNTQITVVAQNATFPGFITFFGDGNVLADEAPSPLETSGHGNWVSTGKNSGAYTFVVLVGNADPSQWLQYTVSGQVNYDPKADTWSGPFTIHIVDQDGTLIFDDTGTMDSTRITAEH